MTNPKYGHEIFAWVVDDPTGGYGIPATPPIPLTSELTGETTMQAAPLITSSWRVAKGPFRIVAQAVAKQLGLPVYLVHFKAEKVIDTVKP